jgi:N-acetylglucosaminyldiphosphoundecaprenol N-acetyl-beta-D-mannosaminyltransferase
MLESLEPAAMDTTRTAYVEAEAPGEVRGRFNRIRLLGGVMDLMTPKEVFAVVRERLDDGRKIVVATHNVFSLALIRRRPAMRAYYELADLIQIDSMPAIFWGRLTGCHSHRRHRSTYLDWREEFWETAEARRWRVFFVGGAEGLAARARGEILKRWPGVQLAVHRGHFDIAQGSPDSLAVLADIQAWRPDVLLVGMGMPTQEVWVQRHYQALPPCAVFTVGGAFEYEAGLQVACPRWIGRLGFEWLFRLLLSPGRLFSRYLLWPLCLIRPALRDLARWGQGKAPSAV